MNYQAKNKTLYLCITAMFSALLFGGKQALAVVPNVEIVTLITAVCAYVWGLAVALPAVLVFILCDVAIFGVNTWIISYVIHWNLVAIVFWLVSKIKVKRIFAVILCTTVAVILTAFFGILTSVVDTAVGFVNGQGFFVDFHDFGRRFAVIYTAGVGFYVVQILSNLGIFAVGFLPLVILNQKIQLNLFGETSRQSKYSQSDEAGKDKTES